jgi:guanylate kinase
MSHKRIVICGPAAAGKNVLRNRLEEKGFAFDVSYTTRPKRSGEKEGIDYKFITNEVFAFMTQIGSFYEHVIHNGYGYGTGLKEWENSDCFIMETDGIKHIDLKNRKKTFIIYLNPPVKVRKERMKNERGWTDEEIDKRIKVDRKKFKNFKDYDIIITDPNF